MIQFILYFLSRYSVKIKVAFLIVFLISGVLFWNVSYLSDTLERSAKTESILEAFETAQKLNTLLYTLQQERSYSVFYVEQKGDKQKLLTLQKEVNLRLEKFGQCQNKFSEIHDKKIDKKTAILAEAIGQLKGVRLLVGKEQIESDEIVRYYTDALIKHFIDLIALMTARVESNDFNAYFNLINAIEYIALEQSLVQVALGNEEVFEQTWYDLLLSQDAKSQTYLDRFKTFADQEVIKAYYKLYSTSAFIELTQMIENLKSQVGQKVKGLDAKAWLGYYNTHMQDIKKVEALNGETVKTRIENMLKLENSNYRQNLWLLVIPLIFTLFIAWFIFMDMRKSLLTLLNFLKEQGSQTQDQVLLMQSKSEFGKIYRTLFEFNRKIKDQIEVIEHTYETDQLTDLPNRNKLLKEMNHMQKSGHNFAVIYIDIYNFSHINDSFGQDVGDIYLRKTAQTLKEIAGSISSDRKLETNVFRMGSDEFVLICSHIEYINLIISKLKEVYIIEHDDIEMPLSFTFGIANSDQVHSQASLLSRAEIASRHAIKTHQRYSYYDEDALFEKRHKANLEWVKKIAEAFKEGLFAVHFQPIASVMTSEIVKYEVLIRMYDKEKELMISPAEFLEVLQNAGHEKELTKLIIDQSFSSYGKCQIDLSINMTRDDLDEEMIDYLLGETAKHGIPPESIVIELVESEELLKPEYISVIQEIKRCGFKVAIDDFGTGYSNFAYLSQIKPDYIKIDGSLIEAMVESTEQKQVVEGIYNFASNLGIEVIAEYVSSDEIYSLIQDIGIEYVQGYHIGHVLSCEEIIQKREEK